MALTSITTGMEKGPEAIDTNFKALDANFKALNVGPDVLYGKVEDHGSGLNGYAGYGIFLRVPIDPKSRMALLFYNIRINNPADNLNIQGYHDADVFKFNSTVMVNDNGAYGSESYIFNNTSVNGYGSTHFQSYLRSDGSITLHVGGGETVAGGGANCYGIKLIKY